MLPNPGPGQTPSSQDFRTQLLQSITNNTESQTAQLMQKQRIETIKIIESLLDSAVVQTAAGKYNINQGDWLTAKKLAGLYSEQSGI